MASTITTRGLLIALLSTTGIAFNSQPRGSIHEKRSASAAKTLFLQTNEADNYLLAIPINPNDGTLSGGVKVATGGHGTNKQPSGAATANTPDPLGSQGSVTVSGNYIFVVNAASNSLTLFEASSYSTTKPRVIGAPAKLPGDFPNSVTVSQKQQLACVGFSGAKSGISCVPFSSKGLGKSSPLHSIDLGQTTTPPNATLNFQGQVIFSDDEQHLYGIVRGPDGFFSSTPVTTVLGKSNAPTVISLQKPNTQFFDGVVLRGTDKVFIADASLGARILSINTNTEIASIKKTTSVSGQKATCWIALSENTGSVYLADAGRDYLVELDATSGAITSRLAYKSPGSGGFDLKAGGNYVYLLSQGNSNNEAFVIVASTSGKQGSLKQVQTFNLTALGATSGTTGLDVMF